MLTCLPASLVSLLEYSESWDLESGDPSIRNNKCSCRGQLHI